MDRLLKWRAGRNQRQTRSTPSSATHTPVRKIKEKITTPKNKKAQKNQSPSSEQPGTSSDTKPRSASTFTIDQDAILANWQYIYARSMELQLLNSNIAFLRCGGGLSTFTCADEVCSSGNDYEANRQSEVTSRLPFARRRLLPQWRDIALRQPYVVKRSESAAAECRQEAPEEACVPNKA